jgi:hypothetical protein
MKHKYIKVDIPSFELSIFSVMKAFTDEWKETEPLNDTHSILASGFVQGMMGVFEYQLIQSGHSLNIYWKSPSGSKLRCLLSKFRLLCREQWLKQPFSPEQWN